MRALRSCLLAATPRRREGPLPWVDKYVDVCSQYALGNTEAEHRRLAWQSERFDPITERIFREAGIGPGDRVLDLGSGAGDVAMLAARLVGPSGVVVGVERDPRSIAHAQSRIDKAALRNVSFTQSDVRQLSKSKPFDAAVGRFILMYIPDPAVLVRTLGDLVRPGGVIAFHEVTWASFLERCAGLPLCSASAHLIHESFKATGGDADVGAKLSQIFQGAGMPAPSVRNDVLLGNPDDFTRWIVGLVQSMRPQIHQRGLSLDVLGDFNTLAERLRVEVNGSNAITGPGFVGAWSKVGRGGRP